MNCPQCGTSAAPAAVRCAACGAHVSGAASAHAVSMTGAVGSDSEFLPTGFGSLDAVLTATPPFPHGDRPSTPGTGRFAVIVPGQVFAGRYHIIRLLGAGGMGAVYQAWDAELGVSVAVKIIRPDGGADSSSADALERRFKRELLLARQVSHKHVVRIHDLGDVDGLKYITMAYVQGADLAAVLREAGRLPVSRALRYAHQIALGLSAAHEVGVVHRDLKPANIMIDEEDQALIMDFGIARSGTSSGSGATGVVGTLEYMPPEQAKAQPTDQRADIYAFGMIVREMLVGRRKVAAASGVADLLKRVGEPLPQVRTIDAAIPEPVNAFVARCLEPDPTRRFQSTTDVLGALGAMNEDGHLLPAAPKPLSPRVRLAIAAAIIVLVSAAGLLVARRSPAPAAAPPVPPPTVSVLVADFENRIKDPSFDGALEQPFVIALEGASFIEIYPRRDALRLAKDYPASRLDEPTARLIAFREGVKYVVAGSVAGSGGGYTLEARAIDPGGGAVLQSASVSSKSKIDVLNAVADLASGIRNGLGDKTPNPDRETFTAGSLDAMREYSTAQDLTFVAQDEAALEHYQKAIQLDPKFGRAFSGAATVSRRLGRQQEAEAFWKQALSLTERMTEREKYRTLGGYYLAVAGNYEKAIESYSALVQAYPADTGGHNNLAMAYFYMRDFAKALQEGRKAIDIYPKNAMYRNNAALYAMYAGDFARAASEAKSVLDEQPSFHKAHLPIAVQAIAAGDMAGAVNAYDEMKKVSPTGASLAAIGRADLDLYAGRPDAIEPALQEAIATDLSSKNSLGAALKHLAIAEAHVRAGRRGPAAASARAALALGRQVETLVPAARVFVRTGNQTEATAIAAELEGQLPRQSRAYGKIVLGEIALEVGKTTEAVDRFGEARQMVDLWLGRFDLGVAYVQAGHFAEALSELELCEKRRGEVTALFFDDVPTIRYLAPLSYWIGRAREGLGQRDAAVERYRAFLALRPASLADPLAADARKRMGGA